MADLKTAIISSIPPRTSNDKPGAAWRDLADVTWATMRKYCDLHGYDFHPDESNLKARVGTPWVDRRLGVPPFAPIRTMIKFPLFLHYLDPEKCGEKYDWVVWMDADCLVTNYEMRLEKFYNGLGYTDDPTEVMVGDLILPYNIDGTHPTIIMARNTPTTLGIMWHCSEAGMRMWQQHDWSDIMAFRFAVAAPPGQLVVWYHHIQKLCAEVPGAYPGSKRMRASSQWTPPVDPENGSLTLHLSAMALEDRIRIAKEYAAKLGLL